ncbi:hypothetical protein XYCOK13_10940 [Xylanibacillus composti]|uniref:Uncharacterized protein n=1 Tax=Xylanibacillus composti TaxID=1572762 RepID=A0A8J4M1P3_9BACL|nr:hypothetical protein XYCOK13_10940 [Xylanibacillus composti]
MLGWLFRSAKCHICGQKAVEPRNYFSNDGKPVKVCFKCVDYAERRALRKR